MADPIAAIALKGGTVIVGNGRVVPVATVLMRDGTITAVGAHVAIPDGTRTIDVSGAFIYPGLIDALTEQATAPSAPAADKTIAGAPPQDQAGPEGGGFFADLRAADHLVADSAGLSRWRDAGVLSLQAALNRGIFTGQTAVVTIGADGSPLTVVRTPVAQRLVLRTLSAPRRLGSPVPGGLFPGALLSVWAHMRQAILDAQHYALAGELDAAQRAGFTWPESTKTLDALRPVGQGALPLVIPAQSEREVRRAIDFAEEMHVKCVVAGGHEAAPAAGDLKKAHVPVLVSLNYPREKTVALGQVRADEMLMLMRVADEFGFRIGTFTTRLRGTRWRRKSPVTGRASPASICSERRSNPGTGSRTTPSFLPTTVSTCRLAPMI